MRSVRRTRLQYARMVAPLALLVILQAAFAQMSFDLEEADARNAAYTIMLAAQERFACELEEHSMRDVGNEPGARYLVFVTAEGDECRDALIFVTNTAAQDDKLLFREIEHESGSKGDPVLLFSAPAIGGDQVLIHEVNPDTVEKEKPEE